MCQVVTIIDVVNTCNIFSCPADSNRLVIVKLKRNLDYKAQGLI